jgi:glycerol-3-phosphate dehydrogenase subunit B
MFDVVVIGGGLAGATAALVARRRGAHVALASRSWGATAMSTGALDIASSQALSPADQLPRTLAEHVMDIAAHRPRHPYGTLGVEATFLHLRQGFDLLVDALERAGLRAGPLELEAENLGLASALGTLMPAGSALGSHLGLDLMRPLAGSWGVVQLHGDASFDAQRVAAGVAADAEEVSGQRPDLVVVPVAFECRKPALALARELDDEAALDRLATALAACPPGLAGLILPPVIGLRRHPEVFARLRELVGLPLVEALSHLPSPPGVRLQQALEAALEAAGIPLVGEAAAPIVSGSRVTGLRTTDALEIRGGAFVLATGRFVSGGVTWTDRCREALFGLPLVTEIGPMEIDSPADVLRETPVESHPLMTAGVQVGSDLRPQREGRLAFENLFAAGMVLGGFGSRYSLCADGVALATGSAAAVGALSALEQPTARRAGGRRVP